MEKFVIYYKVNENWIKDRSFFQTNENDYSGTPFYKSRNGARRAANRYLKLRKKQFPNLQFILSKEEW